LLRWLDSPSTDLLFWVNTLLNDLNIDSYAKWMKKQGNPQDTFALGAFAYIVLWNSDGMPKPALEIWDAFRK